jgi:hypothetical protein
MNKSDLRRIIKEEINQLNPTISAYNDIIELIREKSRALNDDDAYELHNKLKEFFNRLV